MTNLLVARRRRLSSYRRMPLALMAVCVLPLQAFAQDVRSPAVMLERILADLKEARAMVQISPDARTRERVDLLLARAELAARDLQSGISQPAVRSGAITDGDFETFMVALSAQKFDTGRLQTVRSLGRARLTAAQGKQILQKFTFDKDKQEAAVFLHPMLVDPHLFAQLLEAMTFETSRAAVLKRVTR
jgi:hypothetical protein